MTEDLPGPIELQEPDPPSFLAVGIGASTGGLEALEAFAASIPADALVAWIVAQHGSPNHESLLPERLSQVCSLEIAIVESDIHLLPGRVYVVPAGKSLRLDGVRCSLDPGPASGPSPSVDLLLTSLAEVFGEASAGVVLSGTGRDGTAGLRAIRAAGGLTFAQAPETALADGMPREAISNGVTDYVLDPEAMAPEILRIVGHHPREVDAVEARAIREIVPRLAERTSIDFARYKAPTILRRLRRRMGLRGVLELSDYLRLLDREADEVAALTRDLLIGVTSFFRDPAAFRTLRTSIANLVGKYPGRLDWRVWVPACSTGEEAYSIAIVFAECLGEAFARSELVIYGTDADPLTVETARRGQYGEANVAGLDNELRARYLHAARGEYSVAKSIRERLIFARQDVLSDPPFSNLDLLACRNLLIYLEASTQNDLLRVFHHALRSDGLLFLGRSESLGQMGHLFEPVSGSHRLFRRREQGTEPNAFGQRRPRSTTRGWLSPIRRRLPLSDVTARAVADAYGHPAVLVDARRQVLHGRGELHPYFALREGDSNATLIDLAVDELRPALRLALHRASKEGQLEQKSRLRLTRMDGEMEVVDLRVLPLEGSEEVEEAVLVLIEPQEAVAPPSDDGDHEDRVQERRIQELEADLSLTQQSLQQTIEELETLNEELDSLNQELQSTNEELQSSNEELETSNEELQATNEELSTVNDELRAKTWEVHETNVELQSILRCVTTPLVVVNDNLCIKALSHSAVTVLGLPADSVGSRLAAVGDHPILRACLSLTPSVLAGKGSASHELESGGRYLSAQIHPLFDPESHIDGAIVLVHDYTDTRQREREFVALAENAPDIVVRFDLEGRHLYVNQTLEKYTSRPRGEWLGKTNRELGLDDELCRHLEEAHRQVVAHREERSIEFEFKTPSSQYIFEARYVPEFDAQGELSSVISVARDVTEQIRTRNALANEKAKTGTILASISDGFLSLDEELRVTYFNEEAGRMLGRNRAEVLGRRLFDAFPEARGSIFEERYTKAIREQRPDQFEVYFPPHDEWYNVRAYPLAGGLTVFFEVTTNQKRQEEDKARLEHELQHAQKMQALGTLSGGVAHEFNNLLTAVHGFSELLLGRDDLPADAIADVREIVEAADRGRSLVQQILAFSRKAVANPRPFNLNEAVRGVARILERTLDRGIELELELDENLHTVQADQGQIEQILLNLASNARDALEGQGTLRIESRNDRIEAEHPLVHLQPGDYVCLSVSDTGQGMNEEVQQRAFEPFFTTKPPGSGTGLGLSTVYGLVRTHRGHIDCRSTPGEGTCFVIWLPATSAAPEGPSLLQPRSQPARGQGERVLIADDEAPLLRFYERVLRAAGYEPILARSAEEALEVVRSQREEVKLVMLDVGMPGMGGLAGLAALREIAPDVPVVVATGYASEDVSEQARRAGARRVLFKPFGPESLLQTLAEELSSRAPRAATARRRW